MNIEILKEYGIDYEKGLHRFLNDTDLYDEVLHIFLDDSTMTEAEAAIAAEDYQALFACVHALKGACGNVEMVDVYTEAAELTELLRGGCDNPELVREKFEKMQKGYYRAKEGILKAFE